MHYERTALLLLYFNTRFEKQITNKRTKNEQILADSIQKRKCRIRKKSTSANSYQTATFPSPNLSINLYAWSQPKFCFKLFNTKQSENLCIKFIELLFHFLWRKNNWTVNDYVQNNITLPSIFVESRCNNVDDLRQPNHKERSCFAHCRIPE